MHLEYVVAGVPISNQSAGSTALHAWRAAVQAEVIKNWKHSPLSGKLKVIVINFHSGDKPSVDLDNMSKPILDVMQNYVYNNDRQITQVELTHVPIDSPFVIAGASKVIVAAVQAGTEFVYVRVEDPLDPFPLPK